MGEAWSRVDTHDPQFFAPPELRIAHGLMLAAGCLLVAVATLRDQADPTSAPATLEAASRN
jgi:hypothetical protein